MGGGVLQAQGHAVAVDREREDAHHALLRLRLCEAQEQGDEFAVVVDEMGQHRRLVGGDGIGGRLLQCVQRDEGATPVVLDDRLADSMQVLSVASLLYGAKEEAPGARPRSSLIQTEGPRRP